MKTKICIKCNKRKKLVDFLQDERYKDGHINYCKKCVQEYNQKYHKKWYRQNKEYVQQYYQNHKKEILKRYRKYYKNHREFLLEQMRTYYQNNKYKQTKYRKEYMKEYRRTHKKQILKYEKERIKKDPYYKLVKNLRTYLYNALKNNFKSKSTMSLIGCDIEYLIFYLQSQFKKGMSWMNYGKYWEIDHIKPCALFDLSKKSEQLKCFNYKNLQPLTIKENRTKGCNYENK